MRLCNETLSQLPAAVRPHHDRALLRPRLVHLGLGNFHRAHQAWYTDNALGRGGDLDWGICGVSLRSPGVRDRLAPQDGLYTLEVRDGGARRRQVIGSVIEVLLAPEDPDAVVRRIGAADTVTLTVTEKAYGLDARGVLDLAQTDIAHDLAHPDTPHSVIGILARALDARRQAGGAPLNVICCDNITDNGRRLEAAMLSYVELSFPAAGDWLRGHVAFPCTMVDRIVPATTPVMVEEVSSALGLADRAPVISEPFSQWVIENRFNAPVPDWAGSGALLVDDVSPFETAKLRMLNSSHSTLAYLGCLAGLDTVAQAMADPRYRGLLDRFMREEVQPTLTAPRGLDLDAYRARLLDRFANTATGHRLRQIAMDGSQKLPQRLLGTIRDALARGGRLQCLALCVGAWIRYLRGTTLAGDRFEVDDPMAERLAAWSRASGGDVAAFMRASGLFGDDLPAQRRFTGAVQAWFDALDAEGVDEVLRRALA